MKQPSPQGQIPPLPLQHIVGDRWVFQARPRFKGARAMCVISLAVLLAALPFCAADGYGVIRLAAAVSGLAALMTGSIWFTLAHAHRTAEIHFDSGAVTISEKLGANPETRWEGQLADFEGTTQHPTDLFVSLCWREPDLPPLVLTFEECQDQEEFLRRFSQARLRSNM